MMTPTVPAMDCSPKWASGISSSELLVMVRIHQFAEAEIILLGEEQQSQAVAEREFQGPRVLLLNFQPEQMGAHGLTEEKILAHIMEEYDTLSGDLVLPVGEVVFDILIGVGTVDV